MTKIVLAAALAAFALTACGDQKPPAKAPETKAPATPATPPATPDAQKK